MITRLKIKNFKSLKDLELPLRPLTIFVGPNNAGKSNILDCISFLSDLTYKGVDAVSRRGGYSTLVWGGESKKPIEIELELSLHPKKVIYSISIENDPPSYKIVKEMVLLCENSNSRKLIDTQGRDIIVCDISSEKRTTFGKLNLWSSFFQYRPEVDVMLEHESLSSIKPIFDGIYKLIADWKLYTLNPANMKTSNYVTGKELVLQSVGGNLSLVLNSIRSEYGADFSEIQELLKAGIPEIEEVLTPLREFEREPVPTQFGETYLAIREKKVPEPIPVWGVADGTLRLLALITALFSPGAPKVLGFEEPELHVHPHLLELIADILTSAAKRTQILFSTHSPYLLNHLSQRYKDLVIVEKKDGATHCRSVKGKRGLKEAFKVLGLGEAWYGGVFGGVP